MQAERLFKLITFNVILKGPAFDTLQVLGGVPAFAGMTVLICMVPYVQDVRYIAKEHMEVLRACFNFARLPKQSG